MGQEARQSERFDLKNFQATVKIPAGAVQAEILDISEGGARILLPQGATAAGGDAVTVVFGKGAPDASATVRRAADSPDHPGQTVVGLQFASPLDPAAVRG